MTPKLAWACLDMLSSISLREDVSRGGDEKETTGDAYGCGGDEKKEDHDKFHDDISSQMNSMMGDDDDEDSAITSTTNMNKHQSRLEHSFSYNDLSHFNIDAMREQQSKRPSRFSEMNGLRADFVHLYGLSLHSKSNIDPKSEPLQQSSKHARPLLARALTMGNNTVKEVKDTTTKTIVVIPSIDLDRKELQRMCKDIEFYEERQLFHLLMANDPSVRIIYLTSRKVDENVVQIFSLTMNQISTAQQDESIDLMPLVRGNLEPVDKVRHVKNWPVLIDSRGKIIRGKREVSL